MGLLKWFNKSTYSGLGEALGAIRKELQALQPVDSADITWNKTSEGIQAVIRDKATASSSTQSTEDSTGNPITSEYTGYFKIVHRGGRKFAVVNGYNTSDTICGRVDVPGWDSVPRFESELTENQNWAYVYLRAKKNDSKYDVVFETSATFNGPEVLIGIVYADGKVEQSYVGGGTIYFGREWFL